MQTDHSRTCVLNFVNFGLQLAKNRSRVLTHQTGGQHAWHCYRFCKLLCTVGWSTGIDLTPSDVYGLREIIVVAAYIIGGTVGLVLIIAIILTAVQRALLLRQARARACRDSSSRRQLVRDHDSSRGPRSTGNTAADLPPAYDTVMGSPDRRAVRTGASVLPSGSGTSTNASVTSPSSQLLTADDVIRPPSYDDVLHQSAVAK